MAFFRTVFLLLVLANAAFLGYDHYKGGDIAVSLVDQAKHLNVPTVQLHLQNAWTEIKSTTPEKIAGHVNSAFDQLKDFNSPTDVVDYLRAKASGVVSGGSSQGAIQMEGNVFVLTTGNFNKVIDGQRPALIEFYAPWCGHCKKLAPIYEELGDAFASAQDQVVIAKVDADEHRDLGGKFGVQGFPTLKWFPKGVTTSEGVEDYRGGRDLDSLTKFVQEKSGVRPRIKSTKSDVVVLDTKNFDTIVKDPKQNVLVEFYAPWCGHCKNLAPIYEKVANAFANEPNCKVAKIDADSEREIGTQYDVSGFPTIKFFPAGDDKEPVLYESARSEAGFIEFLNKKCGTHRVVGGGLDATAGRVSDLDKLAIKFASTSDKGEREKVKAEAESIAKELGTRNAKFYHVFMKKILESGDSFVKTESARVDRIIKSNTVAMNKVDDFTIRRNILAAFDKKAKPVTKDEL
ncbi:thioredoxin-like protein [Zychaea mexicana]|uniref:thioredoxin-like protein n=1 Tax=Zychaea mexicana TaxID=64656 RepID=UPI0022FEEF45|nr:thioredoxin-like protein [Zychaea mexicana]KAI9499542.1 thioredoxin-like protein [Zychaea mexicana]